MELLTRIRTVLTAAVFWLGIAGTVIAVIISALSDQINNDVIGKLVYWLGIAGTAITTLSLIIRRVTEVIPGQRGLLPVSEPIPAQRDAGFVENNVVWTIVGILAIVALILWITGR